MKRLKDVQNMQGSRKFEGAVRCDDLGIGCAWNPEHAS
jgi:hypothetical protein